MSILARVRPPIATPSLAASATFRTFAVFVAIATPIVYTLCEMQNWPAFTYHPATGRIDLGFALARRDEGPAMYWYGWIVTTLVASAALAGLATLLPPKLTARIPLALTWITPLAAVPVLVYALRFFWRW